MKGFDYKLGAIQMGAERGQNEVLLAFQGMMKTLESLDGFRQM
jgi:hypothetical protein